MHKVNVLGVTLARGGSKGVPRKNVRLLGGLPLIAHTIREVRAARHVTDYCVSSDDAEILNVAEFHGVDHLIRRPLHLAQDDTPTLPALQHAVDEMEEETGRRYDWIAEIRATSPFKTAADIDKMIEQAEYHGAESVIGVVEMGDAHPARAKRLVNGRIRPFCVEEPASGRRQDLTPRAFLRNGSVYVIRRDMVMGPEGRLFGHKFSLPYVMPPERSVNIDTEMDFLLAEVMLEKVHA